MPAEAGVRAVLAGCGLIAPRWARTVVTDGRLRLVALVDANLQAARALAGQFAQVPVYPQLEDALVRHQPAVLLNLTPPHQHAAVTAAALTAGLHVLTEKPLATSADDAADLVELATRQRLTLQVMQNRGMDPTWQQLVREVRRVDTGPLVASVDVFIELPAPGFRTHTSAVATTDLAIHQFDQVRQLISSPPLDVLASEAPLPYRDASAGHCSLAAITVRFHDGSLLFHRGGYVFGPGSRTSANGSWHITGRAIHASWDGTDHAAITIYPHTAPAPMAITPAAPGYATCITAMIDSLIDRPAASSPADFARPAYPSARHSLGSMALLDAALRSVQTGRRCQVRTPELGLRLDQVGRDIP